MGKNFNLIKKLLIFFSLFFNSNIFSETIDDARNLFLDGEYLEAIELCGKINSHESLILKARILSIHAHFFKKKENARDTYLKAYGIAKKVIEENDNLSEAYVEAAHSLGRYGQEIGVLSAVTLGVADRVKIFLLKALKIENNNIIANLSMGIWHAEIINKAGRITANWVYGATEKEARFFLNKTLKINDEQIGVLYETAYGFYLLGSANDMEISKTLIEKLILKKNYARLDDLYKLKAEKLLKKIGS